jgi:hypothetical protein
MFLGSSCYGIYKQTAAKTPLPHTVLSVMMTVAFKIISDVVDKLLKKSLKFCAGKHPASEILHQIAVVLKFCDTTIP